MDWTGIMVNICSNVYVLQPERRRHLYVNISFLFESTPSKHTNFPLYCPHPSYNPPWKKKHPRLSILGFKFSSNDHLIHQRCRSYITHRRTISMAPYILSELICVWDPFWDLGENNFQCLFLNASWLWKSVLMISFLNTMDFLVRDKNIIVRHTWLMEVKNELSRIPFVIWHINTRLPSCLFLRSRRSK